MDVKYWAPVVNVAEKCWARNFKDHFKWSFFHLYVSYYVIKVRWRDAVQKKLRLRNREDFSRIYRNGKSFANSQFVVYWSRQRKAEPFRLGVSASKKIGNAVVRNRMRRLVKEIARHQTDRIVSQLDIIMIVRKPAVGLSLKELEKSMLHVLKRAGLLKQNK